MAKVHSIPCGPSLTRAEVSFGTTDSGVGLGVNIFVQIENVEPAVAFQLTDLAHAFFEDNEAAFAAGILSALTARFRSE